jgi:hypothetical protein
VGRAGTDRTGPDPGGVGGGGRRDERYVTGLWISNDESSFLDEVHGLVWFSFWAIVKEAAVGGRCWRDERRYSAFGFSMTSPVSWMKFTDLFGFLFGPA